MVHKAKRSYRGIEAATYEDKRRGALRWRREARIVSDLCRGMPEGTAVLTCLVARVDSLAYMNRDV